MNLWFGLRKIECLFKQLKLSFSFIIETHQQQDCSKFQWAAVEFYELYSLIISRLYIDLSFTETKDKCLCFQVCFESRIIFQINQEYWSYFIVLSDKHFTEKTAIIWSKRFIFTFVHRHLRKKCKQTEVNNKWTTIG